MVKTSSQNGAIGVACIVIFVTFTWKLLNWVWFKPKNCENQLRKQGVKGSSYKFLHGDSKEFTKMRFEALQKPIPVTNDYIFRVLPFPHKHVQTYGKNCFSWLGPMPVLSITDPELIKEALAKINDFRKPKFNPLVALLAPGIVSYDGDKWATHRKLINPAFQLEKLKIMLPAMSSAISSVVDKWEEMLSGTDPSEIDVWPYFTSLTADIISRAAFGSSFEEGRRIFSLLREQTGIAVRLFTKVYIPGWIYMPTKANKKLKSLNAEIETLVKGIINKREKVMDAGEPPKDDLLGILLDSVRKEAKIKGIDKKQQVPVTMQDLIDECKLFYFAGQESTSVLLAWSMMLLGKHQDWQMRAREEVLAKFGKRQPQFEELNSLKIVTMILNEVLRLYPPVVQISRQVYDDKVKLGTITVPRGAMVSLQILQLHHDPKYWGEDAKEFKPERFSEGIAKATNGFPSYIPFSEGPRFCLGQNFTTMEAKLLLCMVLQRFSFELSPSYAHGPTNGFTLYPQFGVPLIFRRL